ncbi:serine dehydratase subunit alpha family protein [Nitratifractor sp.]|uniref:L-cysteine desulfidase family protein n=1 Tax=Nitratifractor sp. TaxID=2268144 RepID=UPI0025DEFB21|nr:L-serine ammonia-lyase, iron-sulfur-dependent, subunit alpha [Nitratifractor sp.]
MPLDPHTISNALEILHEEVVPAQGCTEPIAIAFVAAKAKEFLPPDETVEKMVVRVSGNIIKNVKSVVVPGSGGMVGIEVAAAMGLLYGDASRDLMVISGITEEQMEEVRRWMRENLIEVIHENTPINLYVLVELHTKKSCISVEIKHLHTNITKITRNREVVLEQPCNDAVFNTPTEQRRQLSVRTIYELAREIDIGRIRPLLEQVIRYNSAIAQEGLSGNWGVNIGKVIEEHIAEGFYGDDVRNHAAAFAAAGSDARMSGCALPVMTTSGSGNQGMAASLALIDYARRMGIEEEKLMRALFFSHLTTVHIKTRVGRLSAYCGVICSAAAVAGALCFINDHDFETVSHAIANTLGDVSGIICDGAKASCAMKISTTIYAAFDSYILATHGKYLHGGDGIVANDIEETLEHIGRLAQDGMKTTDEVIIDIMNSNRKDRS